MKRISRRELLLATAGGAALAGMARTKSFHHLEYDLLVRGGRVIDPAAGLDGVRDVAIADDRVAAIAPSLVADAGDIIDARGKLVVPGAPRPSHPRRTRCVGTPADPARRRHGLD